MADGGRPGLMNNGSGDEWTVVFTAEGAFIHVFDHESTMTHYRSPDRELWPGLLDGIPAVFRPQITEPSFGDEEGQLLATAVLWRLSADDRWHAGEGITFPPTSSTGTSRSPRTTTRPNWTRRRSSTSSRTAPLTDVIVQALNREMTVARLHEDLAAVGYSTAAA
ncbi:hypothetical protein AB0L34_21810 [Micromonospora sp. NPDC052213]|uniref:hypothetical protein n=1 Tax=Micromonospora sp. NPDC052213 TaxID=3155812 RepID=UPI0034208226